MTPGSQLSAASATTLFLLQNVQTVAFLLAYVRTLLGTVSWMCMNCWQGAGIISLPARKLLTQQTPPLGCPISTQTMPETPCALPPCSCHPRLHLGNREVRFYLSSVWSFTSAPGTYHLLRLMCRSCRTESSPASATRSCPAEPAAQQLMAHGTLFTCTPWHRHK